MKFPGIKFGKTKDKDQQAVTDKAAQIAELEGQIKNSTDNLKQTEKKLKKLSGKVGDILDVEPVRPHGPIQELTLEPEDIAKGAVATEETAAAAPKETAEAVKVVEAPPQAPAIVAPPAVTKEKSKTEDLLGGDSLKALFTSEEEEENPLSALIMSMPEVTIDELEEDLREIKEIIKDWQKK
jgi:hypothetical protein